MYDLQSYRLASKFKSYLWTWDHYDFDGCQLRAPQARTFDVALQPQGTNLASVLNTLKTYDERLYRELLAKTREFDPFVDVINFVPVPGGETVFLFVEDSKGKQLGVTNLSNGTLRFMALLFVILRARKTAQTGELTPLIMIEEPENGICIRRLKQLLGLLDKPVESGSGFGQFIFTSHAGYFIDLFDRYLSAVTVMERDKAGTRSFLRRVNLDRARELMEEIPLGEMHFRDIIPRA